MTHDLNLDMLTGEQLRALHVTNEADDSTLLLRHATLAMRHMGTSWDMIADTARQGAARSIPDDVPDDVPDDLVESVEAIAAANAYGWATGFIAGIAALTAIEEQRS
jgi:hypothetical protein